MNTHSKKRVFQKIPTRVVFALNFLAAALVMAVAATATGCGLRDPHFALLGKSQAGLVGGLNNNKVDILWVIDNSGSMGPKQTNLANSINSFMSQFVTKQLDYHIGVITTDIRPVDPTAPNDPNRSGQGACLVGTPTMITPTTPNAASALATNANVGFFGTPAAKPIDAVKMALSNPNLSGCNAGFLRSDAFLAVIIFTDADDNDSTTTPDQLISFLDSVKTPIVVPGGPTVRSYFVSAMGTLNAADAASPNCVASEVSLKPLYLASTTNGTTASICSSDFSSGLLAVSTKILEATSAIRLVTVPNVSTLVVYENGVQVGADAANGYTFDAATNSIFLHGAAIPTGTGVLIVVDYTPVDIAR